MFFFLEFEIRPNLIEKKAKWGLNVKTRINEGSRTTLVFKLVLVLERMRCNALDQ